ncbi:MAG TPA: RIP metalloprotease RseP [Burkholderiales bacterium]|nr:RIP metalloprotease RseP [Burkholderiales bacterium]
MNLLYTIAAFVAALGVLIVIHELGHYWVARWCNVKVLRFSVGFGKPLHTWVRGADHTEWVLAAVPLGGYVKMLDEREGPVATQELPRAFNRQNVWKRIAIVLAGPVANLLLAIALYWILFMHGVPGVRPVVGAPTAASASAKAGFAAGDTLLSIAGERVSTWQDARWVLLKSAVKRGQGGAVAIQVITEKDESATRQLDMSGLTAADLDGDFLKTLGITRFQVKAPPEIGRISAGGAAEHAGLKVGDEIIALNNLRLESVEQAIEIIRAHAGKPLIVELRRDGVAAPSLQVTPDTVTEADGRTIGRMGAVLLPLRAVYEKYRVEVRYGPVDGLGQAIMKTWDTSIFSLKMLGKMLVGEVSLKNLSGPITIADYAGQSAQHGWISYLIFLALISISLGVLNLLPIPLLDGGHLMYYIVEVFKGAPVSEQTMEIGQRVGMGLLLLMMAFALYNDVNRLISG